METIRHNTVSTGSPPESGNRERRLIGGWAVAVGLIAVGATLSSYGRRAEAAKSAEHWKERREQAEKSLERDRRGQPVSGQSISRAPRKAGDLLMKGHFKAAAEAARMPKWEKYDPASDADGRL